ncbi:lysophospholipid acyltransferase family protein [Massilia sp. X63]|uniref:lysophospholipid acyltransferase family protein n=1 Tax=Massilia sp. X63 TaxID=3237285 RepID=UPI0034DD1E9E
MRSLRLARVMVHLLAGLATCALVFPLASGATRERLTRRWSRKLLGLCRVSVEQVDGAPALAHALIVANHVSWLDIFVINALHPCRFVAKAEIRAWPVLGWLAAAAGTVFIARGNRRELRHIFKGLVTVLQEGQRVAFFPEGTTSMQGEVLPFHANLFEAAIDAKVAVQPYALSYVDARGNFHRSVDYTGDTTFVDSLFAILEGEPVIARLLPLAPIEALGAHRRELAQAAQDAVGAALRRDT